MKKFLFLILLSSQISAELMSLECRHLAPDPLFPGHTWPETWDVFTFDKNQGATADVYKYYNGELDEIIEEARLIWNTSSITVKYVVNPGSPYPLDTTATINRENLAYQDKQLLPGLPPSYTTGKCNIVEVVKVIPKKVF